MSQFQDKREPLMTPEYFDRDIAYELDSALPRFKAKLESGVADSKQRARLKYAVFKKLLHLLISRYSRGDRVDELADLLPEIVDALASYLAEPASEPSDFGSVDDYQTALWLVCLARLLNGGDLMIGRLSALIAQDGRDPLYDALVSGAMPSAPSSANLPHATPFSELLMAAAAPLQQGAMAIKRFLSQWYSALSDAYWHDNHKGPDGGGFFGYWAIEAAGVAVAFGIDDSSFRDMPYYPKDLADFGRSGSGRPSSSSPMPP